MSRKEDAFSVFGMVYNIFAVPYNFLIGFTVGLAAPVAAIAAMVAGVRLLTGKVPFLAQSDERESGLHSLSLSLVPPEQVKDLLISQKETIGDDLIKMQSEIKSIIEESRGAALAEEQQEIEVSMVELD